MIGRIYGAVLKNFAGFECKRREIIGSKCWVLANLV